MCCIATRIIALLVVVVVDLVDYLDVLIRDASCFRASIFVVQQLTISFYSSLAVLTNFSLLLRLVGIRLTCFVANSCRCARPCSDTLVSEKWMLNSLGFLVCDSLSVCVCPVLLHTLKVASEVLEDERVLENACAVLGPAVHVPVIDPVPVADSHHGVFLVI